MYSRLNILKTGPGHWLLWVEQVWQSRFSFHYAVVDFLTICRCVCPSNRLCETWLGQTSFFCFLFCFYCVISVHVICLSIHCFVIVVVCKSILLYKTLQYVCLCFDSSLSSAWRPKQRLHSFQWEAGHIAHWSRPVYIFWQFVIKHCCSGCRWNSASLKLHYYGWGCT